MSPCNSAPSSRGPSRGPSPLTVMSDMSGGDSSAVPSPDSSPVAKRKKMITPPKKMENVAPPGGIKIKPEDKQTVANQDLDDKINKQISPNENASDDKQGPANQRVLTLTLPARHRTESKCLDVVDMDVDESLDDIEINESMENVIYPPDTVAMTTNQASMATNQTSMVTNQSMVTTEQMEAYPANMDTIGMMPEMVGNVGGVPVMGMDGGCYVPVPIMPPAGYMPYMAMPMEGYVPMETMSTNPVSMATNPPAVYCDMPQQPTVTIPTDNPNCMLAIHNPSIAMTTEGPNISMATQNVECPQENNNVIKKNEPNEDNELSPEKLANLVAKAKQEAQALMMKGEQSQAENTNTDKELVEISNTTSENSKPGSPTNVPEGKVEKECGTGQVSDNSVDEGKSCDKPIADDDKDIENPTETQKSEDVGEEIAGNTENGETVDVNETKTNTAEEEKGMDVFFF